MIIFHIAKIDQLDIMLILIVQNSITVTMDSLPLKAVGQEHCTAARFKFVFGLTNPIVLLVLKRPQRLIRARLILPFVHPNLQDNILIQTDPSFITAQMD